MRLTEHLHQDNYDTQEIKHLIQRHFKSFDKWWNPSKFNWEQDSCYLAQFCRQYFDIWWNPDKFNWSQGSAQLAQYCSRYFHKWWDPSRFRIDSQTLELLIKYIHPDKWLQDVRIMRTLTILQNRVDCITDLILKSSDRTEIVSILLSSFRYVLDRVVREIVNSVFNR